MNYNLKEIFKNKIEDYSYIILFLLTFSVFIFFAILPSLKTVFSLLKEKKDLESIDQVYERKIMSIYKMQEGLESNRDKIYLIDEAISINPQVNKMIDDIKKAADKNNFFIMKANIVDINLSQTRKDLGKIRLMIEGKISYENLIQFVNDIFRQKRLKTIENLTISKDKETTNSSQLQVFFTIEGYYL